MSETKFTSGPWEISKHQDGSSLIVIGPEDWDIARVDYPDRNPNAHLIAAAPELYESLQKSAEVFRVYQAHHEYKGDEKKAERNKVYAEQMEAVLAKARGEA